jgi:hypothetical protein
MCIAILNRNGVLPKETFENSWRNNPDGGGFAYWDGSKVIIRKELKSAARLWKLYARDRKRHAGDFLIHFRIGTSGLVDLSNCHPFRVSDTAAFIHNGVITDTVKAGNYSDTYHFNEDIVKLIPQRYLNNDGIGRLMSGFIGYSKLVFLIRARAFVVNEHLGYWIEGNWYSNKSHQCTVPAYTYSRPYTGQKYTAYTDNWSRSTEPEPIAAQLTHWDMDKAQEPTYCDNCLKEGATYARSLNADLCPECHRYFNEPTNIAWSS